MPTQIYSGFVPISQSYNTINTLNNPEIQTPNLNRLSKMGVAFTRAYSQKPGFVLPVELVF